MGACGLEAKIERVDKKGKKINENLPNKMQELFTGHMFIPIDVTNKVLKCVQSKFKKNIILELDFL